MYNLFKYLEEKEERKVPYSVELKNSIDLYWLGEKVPNLEIENMIIEVNDKIKETLGDKNKSWLFISPIENNPFYTHVAHLENNPIIIYGEDYEFVGVDHDLKQEIINILERYIKRISQINYITKYFIHKYLKEVTGITPKNLEFPSFNFFFKYLK